MYKLELDQIGNICWFIEKARFQKNRYFCFTECAKAFDSVDHENCGKFLKIWEYQTIWSACWETCMNVKMQHLGMNMEQWTSSKLGKEYNKAIYYHLLI